MNTAAKPTIDPTGPVFVSYRQSDGTPAATDIAWTARAAGVPIWHDQTHLLVGDTDTRLDEALASGLSGSVIVLTADIERSTVMRHREVPDLLRLSQLNPSFGLSVASAVARAGTADELDYNAGDELLRLPPNTLSGIPQVNMLTGDGAAQVAMRMACHRGELLRTAINRGRLELSVQTRQRPHRTGAHLQLSVEEPAAGDRAPGPSALRRLQAGLPALIAAIGAAQPGAVRISGTAHLSIAVAIGATLPATRIGDVAVLDQQGQPWAATGLAAGGEDNLTRNIRQHGEGDSVLAFVDIVPTEPDLTGFTRATTALNGQLAASVHITPAVRGPLNAADSDQICTSIATGIRQLAGRYRTRQVHLLLRCPMPVALHLGRLLNTLDVVVHEWEDNPAVASAGGAFLPMFTVRAGAAGGPIDSIYDLTRRP